jgi:hypothetical protein
VLTARTENYLHGNLNLADTIARLQAYQEAGADVLYAPGLARIEDIRALVSEVDRPVNVLAMPGVPFRQPVHLPGTSPAQRHGHRAGSERRRGLGPRRHRERPRVCRPLPRRRRHGGGRDGRASSAAHNDKVASTRSRYEATASLSQAQAGSDRPPAIPRRASS